MVVSSEGLVDSVAAGTEPVFRPSRMDGMMRILDGVDIVSRLLDEGSLWMECEA